MHRRVGSWRRRAAPSLSSSKRRACKRRPKRCRWAIFRARSACTCAARSRARACRATWRLWRAFSCRRRSPATRRCAPVSSPTPTSRRRVVTQHKKTYTSYRLTPALRTEIEQFAAQPDAYGQTGALDCARNLGPRARQEGAAAADGGRHHAHAARRHADTRRHQHLSDGRSRRGQEPAAQARRQDCAARHLHVGQGQLGRRPDGGGAARPGDERNDARGRLARARRHGHLLHRRV
jgi:hypothetical protein